MKALHTALVSAALIISQFWLASAHATLLDFSFTTDRGNGSFTLDTSVSDTDPSPFRGFYLDAVMNSSFNANLIPLSNLSTLDTFDPSKNLDFAQFVIKLGDFDNLFLLFRGPTLAEALSLVNNLDSDSAVYLNSLDVSARVVLLVSTERLCR